MGQGSEAWIRLLEDLEELLLLLLLVLLLERCWLFWLLFDQRLLFLFLPPCLLDWLDLLDLLSLLLLLLLPFLLLLRFAFEQ